MTTSRLASLIAAAGVFVSGAAMAQQSGADPAAVSTGVPVYQGTAFVTKATPACTSNAIVPGSYYTMLYRQKVESGNTTYGGGIAFSSERSSVSYVMPANTPLNGGKQTQKGLSGSGQSSKVGPYVFTGDIVVAIAPATLTATTASVQITGTASNFFNFSGCTITFRASLALRP